MKKTIYSYAELVITASRLLAASVCTKTKTKTRQEQENRRGKKVRQQNLEAG